MNIQISLPYDRIALFCQRHSVSRLMLFGSVLRADFTPQSDVDVLVEFEPYARTTYFELAEMEQELTSMLGRKIDLGTPKSLSPHIEKRVLASAQVIYERGR